jgi:hypothetical protein
VPYYIGVTKYYQVASAVHAAVAAGLSHAVVRSAIVPGAIAWDEAPCGSLYVSIGPAYLSDNFPAQAETVIGFQCDAAWEVVQIVVQVIRCAPQPQGQSLSPTVAAQDATAQIMATDQAEVMKSISTWICQQRGETIVDGIMSSIDPQGPDGDAVGVQATVLVAVPRA